MARVFRCNRCGSFYTPYVIDIEENSRKVTNHYVLDLCPVCMNYILRQLSIEDGA